MPIPTLAWIGDETGHLQLLDQTRLPAEVVINDCRSLKDVWNAIKTLQVRGAPAIGVAAAYGLVIGLQSHRDVPRADFDRQLETAAKELAGSRPTAVNLFWALDRLTRTAARHPEDSSKHSLARLFAEARAIEAEDKTMCDAMARHGAPLLEGFGSVLTHCNAGALATAGDGTALAVIFEAARRNPNLAVYADETRPLCQGARLTAWELTERNIPCTVICDNMAGWVMKEGRVQAVIVGADRIAANGDTANKIGTYSVATLAKAHNIPFYVAAPSSTFDLSLNDGGGIPIEERAREEITRPWGRVNVPDKAGAYNPAFDVTPADLIAAIVTERGVISPVNRRTVHDRVAPAHAVS
jgi:methylthioribose-1-phosphate isomerase